jgi:hypothetical protein
MDKVTRLGGQRGSVGCGSHELLNQTKVLEQVVEQLVALAGKGGQTAGTVGPSFGLPVMERGYAPDTQVGLLDRPRKK